METIKIGETELKTEDVTQALQDGGFVVRTKDQDLEAKTNFVKGLSHEDERVTHIVDPLLKRERTAFEDIIKKHTGKDRLVIDNKPQNAFEYGDWALDNMKSELESKAQKGVKDEQLKTDYETLKRDYEDFKKLKVKESEEHKRELGKLTLSTDIEKAMSKLQFKEDIDNTLLNTYLTQIKSDILQNPPQKRDAVSDGKELVFIEDSGSIQLGEDGNPLTLDRFLNSRLDPYLHKDRVVKGSGIKKPSDTPGSVKEFSMSSSINSRSALIKALTDAGLENGSDKFMELYNKHKEGLPYEAQAA